MSKVGRREAIVALSSSFLAACRVVSSPRVITIGGKNFTEQFILTEIVAQLIERNTHFTVQRKPGSPDADHEIMSKRIDAYVEYSGTAWVRNLGKEFDPRDEATFLAQIKAAYRGRGLEWFPSLGFRDDFAIVILKSDSDKYAINTLADARRREAWRVADGADFQARPDGLAALLTNYEIHLSEPPLTRNVDELYKMLEDQRVDMIIGNSTDRLMGVTELFRRLDDTQHIFPPYDAAIVARIEALNEFPTLRPVLEELTNKISLDTIRSLISRYDEAPGDRAAEVARDFLNEQKM